MRRVLIVSTLVMMTSVGAVAPAMADQGPSKPQVSNMGFCSAQLAKTPGRMGLAPNARAEVNQILRLFGAEVGIPRPGALYSVRARTTVEQDGVCQQR